MHEIYYNQDGRGSDAVSLSRLCDSVPRNPPAASSSSAQSASVSKATPTLQSASASASTPAQAGAGAGAAKPEATPKVSIRPLDRKAYLAGREVIRKINNKLHREVVSHRGHLKRVSVV